MSEKSLAEKYKLPEVLGAVIAIGLTLLASFIYKLYSKSDEELSEGAKHTIETVSVSLAVVILSVGSWLIHYYRTRKRRRALDPKGTRLAIYVANLGDTDEAHAARQYVIASIRENFSSEHAEVLPAGRTFHLTEGVSEDEAALQPANEARAFLAKHRGDLMLWGSLQKWDGKTHIELRLVPAAQNVEASDRQIYSVTEKLTLDPTFGPAMGATLAAQIASLSGPAYETGRYVADILQPIAARLQPFVDHPPTAMLPADLGKLFYAYADIQETLGEQTGESRYLKTSISAFYKALDFHPRERVPLDWAMTQNNLGIALQTLGQRESGTDHLLEAVQAYRNALLEQTRDRVPLKWAMTQNNLGAALRILDEREPGTERLLQAVQAYRDALLEHTRERVPLDWAMTQQNLGNTLWILGELESGTDRLLQARQAFQKALLEYTEESSPYHQSMTQGNLDRLNALIAERTANTIEPINTPS